MHTFLSLGRRKCRSFYSEVILFSLPSDFILYNTLIWCQLSAFSGKQDLLPPSREQVACDSYPSCRMPLYGHCPCVSSCGNCVPYKVPVGDGSCSICGGQDYAELTAFRAEHLLQSHKVVRNQTVLDHSSPVQQFTMKPRKRMNHKAGKAGASSCFNPWKFIPSSSSKK